MQMEHLVCTAFVEQLEVNGLCSSMRLLLIRGQWEDSSCLYNFAIEWEARVNETNASGNQTLWRPQSSFLQFANQV